jgi:2-methylcitrate dehydratase
VRATSHPIARRQVLAGLAALGLDHWSHAAGATAPLAERLAAYALALRYAELDAPTIEAVKSHLIDTLGCAIAAFDEKPVRICREVAAAGAGGGATLIGTAQHVSPDLAAFANGGAARYYDLNDVYVNRLVTIHPSDTISACLAVGEAQRANGQALITAIALAYEINCRLLDAFDITKRGWDTPVFGLPAVALAAGKLMRLPLEQMTEAVNLAINDHIPMIQTRMQTLSDWKGLAAAEAARNAVFAALLARGGITGPAPIFEGRAGFFKQVSGAAEIDVDAFGRQAFRINACGMKPYPAVVWAQTAIDAALAVAREAGSLDQITAIEVAATARGYQMTGSEAEKWAPDTRETADHSMPYIVARAMFDGEITNNSYAPDKLTEARIRAFMRKITVHEDRALTARQGDKVPTRVTATLSDGRRISREVDDVPGFAGRPMQRVDVERKFRSNVGKRWREARIRSVLDALWGLDQIDDLGALLGGLIIQAT